MNFGDARLAVRFWNKAVPEPMTGCWLWLGATSPTGYGHYFHDGKYFNAHRIAYVTMVGAVPAGLQLDHLCRVRCCVNPSHLEPVTPRVNTLRGTSPSSLAAKLTSCINGHLLSADNLRTIRGRERQRICRACSRERDRQYHARRAA